ncbi:hypothetical protein ETB91_13525 [Lacticaseibacillus rhamnosus]|uniref:hypothetical protein n=1 Tax=Lacticaseibacillus rhamnosus TaxID=47715 RepID=UPI000979B1CF|nr:hypothetical protein [Lacticaseibacillus rhamnosus]AQG71703.1 hypothetical protein AWJ15_01395 [Lacticaseibacillus rhamnosus]RXS52007.1 hypothetical protein ETB91_13525 [Lacticaseibacillus rhamnosus]
MNDRHRAVMRARKEQIMYERRKYEHKMDEFAKALYPVFKAAAATIEQWLAAFQVQVNKKRA